MSRGGGAWIWLALGKHIPTWFVQREAEHALVITRGHQDMHLACLGETGIHVLTDGVGPPGIRGEATCLNGPPPHSPCIFFASLQQSELTIFLMAALEWSAAVEMSSRDPV